MGNSDAALLKRIASGDRQAMQALYSRYADRLFRFALPLLQDPEDAEDVVQETLMTVWRNAASFRGSSQVSTWLFGICRNKAREKRRQRQVATEPLELAEVLPAATAGLGELELWNCFKQLSEDDQELILLVFHHGFSQQEVAEVLRVPVDTIKSRTFHARRRLQRLLEGGDKQ